MRGALLRGVIALSVLATVLREQVRDERGEGVISTAIAVLIMAAIGLAMWFAFDRIWQGAEGQIEGQIQQIGQ